MIAFRNHLKEGKVDLRPGKRIAIGAYDLSGDLIAVCRDFTNSEIQEMHESGFVEDTGIKPKKATEDPTRWDCWEVIIEIADDSKRVALQKMLSSIWILSSGIQNLLEK